MSPGPAQAARDLVVLEALLLDERDWAGWLALWREDAVFWVPAWKNDDEFTTDPDTELSFIYLQGKARLAERVKRATGGRSAASLPLPRTAHVVVPARIEPQGDERMRVTSAWSSHIHDPKSGELAVYAGRYIHELARDGDAWRIARKTIVLAHDLLVSRMDFFHF